VAELASRQVQETLTALASRTEPPAAGVASALAAATAAALVELTAGLAADRLGGDEAAPLRTLGEQASDLRERLLAIADDDARTYAQVTRAKGGTEQAQALERASGPPLAVAEAAAEVAEAAAQIARAGNWAFRADAVVAGELAAAAATSGAEMVATNLASEGADPRIDRARDAAERARRAREQANEPPSS
jgi:formiminotetrahydrofolate cyclodeaminase